MTNAFRKYGIFLLIPGIVLGFSVLLKLAAGPYWLITNQDPAYIYLINGLHLLKGVPVNEATHPGTPLQLLCCAVCWLFNIGRPVEDAVAHVLMAPEFYLHVVFLILLLLSFFTSLVLAVYVYRKTNDKLAAVLTQLPALSFLVLKSWEIPEPVHPIVANVSPEPMLMSILNLFNTCLFLNLFAKTTKDKYTSALIWGFVCGLGTAVKFTFIPLLIIPLIVLSWKNRTYFIGVFMATFFIWTLPALSKYPLEWSWISNFIMHRGGYGPNGLSGGFDISSYLLNWKNIIVEYWVFSCFLSAAFFLTFWKLTSKEWNEAPLFLLATALGVLFQFSIVAHNPGAHYLLPGLGLFSSLLSLLYLQSASHHVLGRRIFIVFIVAATLAGAWRAIEYRSTLATLTKDVRTFYEDGRAKYKGYIFLGFYGSSGQDSALRSGDAAGWDGVFQLKDELFRAYPDSFFFNKDKRYDCIVNFKNERVFSNDLLAQSSGIIFQGDSIYADLDRTLIPSPFSLRLLQKGRLESIYLLTGTTEKSAVTFFLGAVHFFQIRDYRKALVCALQAKAFHYEPRDDLDKFIGILISYTKQS